MDLCALGPAQKTKLDARGGSSQRVARKDVTIGDSVVLSVRASGSYAFFGAVDEAFKVLKEYRTLLSRNQCRPSSALLRPPRMP